MRKNKLITVLLLIASILLCACSSEGSYKAPESTFCIQFIDVGQGDAALIECDGRYMLIDGGDTSAADTVYNLLVDRDIKHLDFLVMTHLHADHIGGLPKALTYATNIDKTICNSDYADTEIFRKVSKELGTNGATITIPHEGDKYNLGSAEVEVIYAKADEPNDSLVLMVTYGDTQFLFTGDIEETAQKAITEKYVNPDDKEFKIDLIKMPHHGSDKSEDNNIDDITSSMYRFLRTFMPEYAVISVGAGNKYGHPGERTLSLLLDLDARVYRTDENGDITVKSNGNTISVTTSR